jgi:hypothetical protein
MKVSKGTLKIVGVVSTVGLLASIYIVIQHRVKDKLAVGLIQELNKLLNPNASGLMSEEAFDIHYAEEAAKKVKGILLIKTDAATKFAKDIYSAFGFLDDDEDKIYSVFRSLKDKVQVSQVAKAFQNAYRINLIDKLRAKLSEGEVSEVLKIVNALPRYRVVG